MHRKKLFFSLILLIGTTICFVPAFAENQNNAGLDALKKGEYKKAEQALSKLLSLNSRRDKQRSDLVNQLATAYDAQATALKLKGQFKEAETLFKKSLSLREKELGKNSPDIKYSIQNLSSMYSALNRLDKVGELINRYQSNVDGKFFQEKVTMEEKILGPDSLMVAESLNDLAMNLDMNGKYTEALPLYQRALKIGKSKLGPNHPFVAATLKSIAMNYSNQNNNAQYESFIKQSQDVLARAKAQYPEIFKKQKEPNLQ